MTSSASVIEARIIAATIPRKKADQDGNQFKGILQYTVQAALIEWHMSAFIKELLQNSLGRASATSSLCLITALHKTYIFFFHFD